MLFQKLKYIFNLLFCYLIWKSTHQPLNLNIKPIHIIFLFVDHFEPKFNRKNGGPRYTNDKAFWRWIEEYPKLASKHKDSNGRHPQHTWFYPYDHMNIKHLEELSKLCKAGFGEIELHLHHKNDTSESLEAKLNDAIEQFSKVGALKTIDNKTAYGFIHGRWALDNCDGTCGVNDEISILLKTGCYADFGLPAQNKYAWTKKINKIYYAIDDPLKPKSFETGPEVKVGKKPPENGLMMIPGPLRIDWTDWRFKWHPFIDDGEIRKIKKPSPKRVDLWINTNIHVPGRPDWVFVKVFTHGCVEEDLDTLLGKDMDKMFTYLEKKYNDGKKYVLHYITAREAFNIIKAIESKYYDLSNCINYILKPYNF